MTKRLKIALYHPTNIRRRASQGYKYGGGRGLSRSTHQSALFHARLAGGYSVKADTVETLISKGTLFFSVLPALLFLIFLVIH